MKTLKLICITKIGNVHETEFKGFFSETYADKAFAYCKENGAYLLGVVIVIDDRPPEEEDDVYVRNRFGSV